MVLVTIVRQVTELFALAVLSTKECGEIPYYQRSRVKQMRCEIERIIIEAQLKLGINFSLLEYFYSLIASHSCLFESFDKQMVITPAQKFFFLRALSERVKILSWHIQNTDQRQVNIKTKALSSGAIPQDCKLTQTEVEELIEECKLLLMQSKSIVDYSNQDLARLVSLMNSIFGNQIQIYVSQHFNSSEKMAYQQLVEQAEELTEAQKNYQSKDYETQQEPLQYGTDRKWSLKLSLDIDTHENQPYNRQKSIFTPQNTPRINDQQSSRTRIHTIYSNQNALEEELCQINQVSAFCNDPEEEYYEEEDDDALDQEVESFRAQDGKKLLVSTLETSLERNGQCPSLVLSSY